MRDLRVISRPSGDGSWRVDSGVNSSHSGTHSRPILRKPHQMSDISLHLAVGRALWLEYVNIGVLGWSW